MADDNGSSDERASRTLRRLADTLGCAPEVFFNEPGSDPVAAVEELLRLWHAIADPSQRLRVLDFARAVKAEADAKGSA